MKRSFILISIFLFYFQGVKSQGVLDKFIERRDSINKISDSQREFYSGFYSDTIVNDTHLKVMSEYSPDHSSKPDYYYGRISIKDGKVLGDQPPVILSDDFNMSYLYSYREDGTLYSEGIFSGGDCLIGPYIQYFRNGIISKSSNHIKGTEDCSALDGESDFYNYKGDKIISEFWNNDKLIKVVPYKLNITGDIKFSTSDKVFLINDTICLDDFMKIKISPDTNQNTVLINGYVVRVNARQKKKDENLYMNNLGSFNDSAFTAELRIKKIDLKTPMQLNIEIYETKGNEIIEKHYLVFYNK